MLRLTFGVAALAGAIQPGAAQQFAGAEAESADRIALPDAPSVTFLRIADENAQQKMGVATLPLPPCPPRRRTADPVADPPPDPNAPAPAPCMDENPLRIVVNEEQRQPLSMSQKGLLAVRIVVDPLNLAVQAAQAGIGVAANAHSAYGSGMKGFGRLLGYELLQDTQTEFFGTFLIPTLVHEDPRYRRMQKASIQRRVLHALSRTVIAQHDDGRSMPNYATLLTYPISAELSNLYVPGVRTNGPATARRIAIGFATDPAGNLIAEFLPDIARRIHVRSIFVQQIVNSMALGQGATP